MRRHLLYTGGILIAACGSPVSPATDPLIRTDSTAYTLQSNQYGLRVRIAFTFTNLTGSTVYVSNCDGSAPPALQKLENGEWVAAWFPVEPLCASQPIVIGPAEAYSDTLRVFAGHPPHGSHPRFTVSDPTGVFRLVWHGWDGRRALPLQQRISNEFTLTLQ